MDEATRSPLGRFVLRVTVSSVRRGRLLPRRIELFILVEFWNGTSWTITPNTNPGVDSTLFAVSCPGKEACDGAGHYSNAYTLAESGRRRITTSHKTIVGFQYG